MSKPSFDRPIILGIVGDSAAGKTTLSRGIAEILGPQRCTLICTDDYHRYDRRERAANGVSALDPAGNYVDILEQHLHLLRQGQPILDLRTRHRHQRARMASREDAGGNATLHGRSESQEPERVRDLRT